MRAARRSFFEGNPSEFSLFDSPSVKFEQPNASRGGLVNSKGDPPWLAVELQGNDLVRQRKGQ